MKNYVQFLIYYTFNGVIFFNHVHLGINDIQRESEKKKEKKYTAAQLNTWYNNHVQKWVERGCKLQ